MSKVEFYPVKLPVKSNFEGWMVVVKYLIPFVVKNI